MNDPIPRGAESFKGILAILQGPFKVSKQLSAALDYIVRMMTSPRSYPEGFNSVKQISSSENNDFSLLYR